MKILVISDTHGELKTAENVMLRHDDVDLTVHLGDFYKDAKKLEELTEKKILALNLFIRQWIISKPKLKKIL